MKCPECSADTRLCQCAEAERDRRAGEIRTSLSGLCGEVPADEYWCLRCGKLLTTPEGIQTGICAECWRPEDGEVDLGRGDVDDTFGEPHPTATRRAHP